MPALENYRMLAQYKRWMNTRLYACAARLGDDQRRRTRGAFCKSIHGTLNHLLVGDHLWMGRFECLPFTWQGHAHELHSEFDPMRRAREAMDVRIVALVERLKPEWIAGPFEYSKLSGTHVRVASFAALTHFFNHQTHHHRGQATTLLMQVGVDPGETDLVAMAGIQQEATSWDAANPAPNRTNNIART